MARQHENLCTMDLGPYRSGNEDWRTPFSSERREELWAFRGTDSSIYLQIIATEYYRSSAFDRYSRTPFIDFCIRQITIYLFTRNRNIKNKTFIKRVINTFYDGRLILCKIYEQIASDIDFKYYSIARFYCVNYSWSRDMFLYEKLRK